LRPKHSNSDETIKLKEENIALKAEMAKLGAMIEAIKYN
jgi:hypothetical protein